MQRVDRAVDRAGRGERPEIVALAAARAAMLEDAGGGMVAGQQDIGERLVVPHQHVEARPQPLDEVRFQQQRLGLGAGDDELHRRRLAHHPADAVGVEAPLRVVGHALLQAARLADVENVAGRVHHAVDAGRVGQPLDQPLDHLGADAAGTVVLVGSAPVDAGDLRRARRRRLLGRLDDFGLVVLAVPVRHVAGHVVAGAAGLARDRRRLARPAHSAIPATSGVSQARCWPPSSAIICPVTERAAHR